MSTHNNQETAAKALKLMHIVEELLDEIIDLEEHANSGKPVPHAKGYRVRINGHPYVIDEPHPTRERILEIAERVPPKNFNLFLKVRGQNLQPIAPGAHVDLRHPGVEKFKVLPRDQTEG